MLKKILFIALVLCIAVSCKENKSSKTTSEPLSESSFIVKFEGPGGHSNGAYGNVNAIHAASRTLMALEGMETGISWSVTNFEGGNSVNSIAATAEFKITAKGSESAISTFKNKLNDAVSTGIKNENSFRGKTEGGTDNNGGRVDIRATVSPL